MSFTILQVAEAIATAEGFYVPVDSPRYPTIPQTANNPGDLVMPGWQGQAPGSEKITVFSSIEEGWTRLKHQLLLIVNGTSHVYSLDDTISTMAAKWTRTSPAEWAVKVANALGVQTGTTLRDLLFDTLAQRDQLGIRKGHL